MHIQTVADQGSSLKTVTDDIKALKSQVSELIQQVTLKPDFKFFNHI